MKIEQKKPKKKIKKGGFIEYVLFNPQSFGIISAFGLIMGLAVCVGLAIFGAVKGWTPMAIIFGLFSIVAVVNIYKRRGVFRAFNKNKKEELLDITIADGVNAMFGKEEK